MRCSRCGWRFRGRYPGDSAVNGFWDRALPLVRQAPGIVEAALGTSLPPDDGGNSFNNFDLVDRPVPAGGAQPTSPWPSVSPAYFAALGVPMLDGRIFSPIDSANAPPVAVVSRAWAQRYFPEGGVVGRRLVEGGCSSCPPTTIVGVVGNVKYEGLGGTGDAVYVPFSQGTRRDVVLFVRTVGAPLAALDGVRRALKSADAALPLDDAASMEERLDDSVSQPRHWTTLLGGFAGVALSLAVVGIFGMFVAHGQRPASGDRRAHGPRSPGRRRRSHDRAARHATGTGRCGAELSGRAGIRGSIGSRSWSAIDLLLGCTCFNAPSASNSRAIRSCRTRRKAAARK